MKYKVVKAFENHAAGDEIELNPRQAKYKELSGHLVKTGESVVTDADSMRKQTGFRKATAPTVSVDMTDPQA